MRVFGHPGLALSSLTHMSESRDRVRGKKNESGLGLRLSASFFELVALSSHMCERLTGSGDNKKDDGEGKKHGTEAVLL